MGKKVLITGGTGMIGKVVAKKLKERGNSVRILTRSKSSSGPYDYYQWDPSEWKIDQNSVVDVDIIIHLAGENIGEKKWTKERKKELTDSRINSTRLLRDAIDKVPKKPEAFISTSAIGYYGYDTGSILMKENSRFGDDFLATLVKKWEAAADGFEQLGMRVIKFRTGIVLGQNGGALSKMAGPVKIGLGAALGRGDQYISWIHLQDLADLYVYSVKTVSMHGIYNAVAPEPVTNKTFMQSIATTLKKPFFLPNVPSFALKLALGEMSSMIIGGNRVSSEKIASEGFEFRFKTLNSALENLWRT